MRYALIIIVFFLPISLCCKGQVDNGDKYNRKYLVGEIENVKAFMQVNHAEESLASLFNSYDRSTDSLITKDTTQELIKKNDFFNNRSRILLTEVVNGVESINDGDKIGKDGFSTLCDCSISMDTLLISSGFGFFGGVAIIVKVFANDFQTDFNEYTDDVKPYKLTLESEFTDNITVESKYQYLKFDQQRGFKIGQQLTGFLTLTSKDFFEDDYGEKLDTKYVRVKMYFTCLTKQRIDNSW